MGEFDGWTRSYFYCAKEGCNETRLRLSGFCLKHDLEALKAVIDAPPYINPFPNGFGAYLKENMKNLVFKAAYEKRTRKDKTKLDS